MPDELEMINKALEKTLNQHGYSYQYSVTAKTRDLYKRKKSLWQYPVFEFPVEVQGYGTRIDAILKYREHPYFLLIETKRANPALSNWCFLKSPLTSYSFSNSVVAESITKESSGQYHTNLVELEKPREVFQLGIEVKANKPGDPNSKGRGGIERAVTQILRGLNGVIEYLYKNTEMLNKYGTVTFLPAIITTARLFYSDANISSADLNSGEIDLSDEELSETDWLFYNYPQSPGLKHSVPSSLRFDDFENILANKYIRTIPIINSGGIEDFLIRRLFD